MYPRFPGPWIIAVDSPGAEKAGLPTSVTDLQGDCGCTRRGGVTAGKEAVYADA